ncbi:uncharacterized protein EV154DRAFT_568422 [Mucor mucedo]|uniref:uncharacterized protein n=1 Tax=Mucor mucedo TaxID=29922 RepID=UPI002220A9FF|nr:uncharacterized protein EV154DRAFT_568422 [Mucor mucedo]KAI7880788.1 hypothetical protein EV154DRAFT_568422 [Mucor mucedo]
MSPPSSPLGINRTVTNDLNEVYDCASQISDQLRPIHANVQLPSISELDGMIDNTGKMMRVLDDAKQTWFIPSVTQHRPVVSNPESTSKRSLKRQRTSSNALPSKNQCHSCKSTETPEWRKGPLGPRTLCNACGLIWTKLCKQQEEDDSSRRKFKNNSSTSSPVIVEDGISSSNNSSPALSSSSLKDNNKKYTLSFLLS